MTGHLTSDLAPPILRFYARCLLFPYEEMGYGLHHMFRQLEIMTDTAEDVVSVHDILALLNTFQGEDIQELRADFVFLFSNRDRSGPVCPMLAGEFAARFALSYDAGAFIDLLFDRDDFPVDEESIDSVVNYLEYLAAISENPDNDCESGIMPGWFLEKHILPWIPGFCDILYKSANISFYRELAGALKRYLLGFAAGEIPG